MPDTEQVDTFAKLSLIVKRARKEPESQFKCLAHLLNEGYLKACYMKLGRDRACGIDDVTLKSRMWEIYKSGSVRGIEITSHG